MFPKICYTVSHSHKKFWCTDGKIARSGFGQKFMHNIGPKIYLKQVQFVHIGQKAAVNEMTNDVPKVFFSVTFSPAVNFVVDASRQGKLFINYVKIVSA